MLQIRNSQIDAINSQEVATFKESLRKHLNSYFPGAVPDAGWDAVFERGMRKCRKYRLRTEYGITVFFNLATSFGQDFDKDARYPWAAELLSDKYLAEDLKIRRLIARSESTPIN